MNLIDAGAPQLISAAVCSALRSGVASEPRGGLRGDVRALRACCRMGPGHEPERDPGPEAA